MAMGGSADELSWSVEEDAFGVRYSEREREGRALLTFLLQKPSNTLSSCFLLHID